MSGLEFAKRMLKNQGWKEGSGLGKQEDGRAEPIKVALKKDKRGVGHNLGEEFTDHWWLRVFNEAAQKIGGKKGGEIDRETVEKKSVQNNLYKGFVKSSTLADGVELSVRESESEEDEKLVTEVPTLDDIYKFCGGATGHRAAMFGIKMKGKLSRVAKQDLHFEEKLKKHTSSPDDNNTVEIETENNNLQVDRKKKKKSKKTAVLQFFDSPDVVENGDDHVHKKKKRKKKNGEECSDKDSLNNSVIEESVKQKKRGIKSSEIESYDNQETEENADISFSKKKKKKRYKQEQDEISVIDCENSTQQKHKKRKRHLEEEINSKECNSRKSKNKV